MASVQPGIRLSDNSSADSKADRLSEARGERRPAWFPPSRESARRFSIVCSPADRGAGPGRAGPPGPRPLSARPYLVRPALFPSREKNSEMRGRERESYVSFGRFFLPHLLLFKIRANNHNPWINLKPLDQSQTLTPLSPNLLSPPPAAICSCCTAPARASRRALSSRRTAAARTPCATAARAPARCLAATRRRRPRPRELPRRRRPRPRELSRRRRPRPRELSRRRTLRAALLRAPPAPAPEKMAL
ncbi:hypothetical protein PVAP13_7KG243555 [Panicum virgatum]|uniref:Uncharacterized protein n=1 Tax=Panicum virgatum TaxID=38727 RepID=A0A8T0QGS3_PANVG|nr:hypothetical protein PVAP13_7KG243555 [Panicum virgatum]